MIDPLLDGRVPTGPIEQRWDQHKFDMKLVNPANKRKYTVIVVGSGLAGKTGQTLMHDLESLTSAESPFATDVPAEDSAGATWVHPVLVADVQSLGLSGQGKLRQPAYKGLRSDLTPGDVDDHGILGRRERQRRGQAGGARPDDQDVILAQAAAARVSARKTSSRSGSRVETSTMPSPAAPSAASTSPALTRSLR